MSITPASTPAPLLAGQANSASNAEVSTTSLRDTAQALLDQVQSALNLSEGDVSMFVFGPPSVPPQSAPVMIAQAAPKDVGSQAMRTIGYCMPVPTFQAPPPIKQQGEYSLSLLAAAQNYFDLFEHKTVNATGTVALLESPKHGSLIDDTGGDYRYLPNSNYLGKDSATFLVDLGGRKVKVVVFFHVTDGPVYPGPDTADGGAAYNALCKQGAVWKISSLSPDLQSDAGRLVLEGEPKIQLNVVPLANGAVGETVGEETPSPTITLSPNAVGYSWFTDGRFDDEAVPDDAAR